MRFLLKVSIPVEAGNEAARRGTLGKTIGEILGKLKPEAAYFAAEGGQRTGFLIVQMENTHQIPSIAEPWFLAFNAAVEFLPVMLPEDLERAGAGIAEAVRAYA